MFTVAMLVALVVAVVGAVIGGILFELIRERTMKAVRAVAKATGWGLNANVSKPVVLLAVVVVGVFIAVLLLRTIGLHLVV